jgi:membrane protein DedA with SNARE-associated domain
MLGQLNIEETLAFVERHGYSLLFFWVLAEQSAIPVPSTPLLLAVGALIRAGRLNALPALICATIAAVIADTIWFEIGRNRGRRVLRFLCRVSLEPDSCVRRTEDTFRRRGMGALLVSKFVPGLNTVAAPLAGSSRTSYGRFALYDAAGALIWSGSYLALGYIFSEQLKTIIDSAANTGANLLLLVVILLALWICRKFFQRRRFLKQLEMARITPAELQDRFAAGEDLFIVDLRGTLAAEEQEPIPGAVRFSLDELANRSRDIPRDRDIILFCS